MSEDPVFNGRKIKVELTQSELKSILDYDPTTGIFTWIDVPKNTYLIGKQAGAIHKHGYPCITIKGSKFMAHRLAFLWMQGQFPKEYVDHIDGNRSNNKWSNLRTATMRENGQNQAIHRMGHKPGTHLLKKKLVKPWESYIELRGKRVHIARFQTEDEAYASYLGACAILRELQIK